MKYYAFYIIIFSNSFCMSDVFNTSIRRLRSTSSNSSLTSLSRASRSSSAVFATVQALSSPVPATILLFTKQCRPSYSAFISFNFTPVAYPVTSRFTCAFCNSLCIVSSSGFATSVTFVFFSISLRSTSLGLRPAIVSL